VATPQLDGPSRDQALTVFASAIGPLFLAWGADATGSHAAAF
jgi:hypothetical protein